jgi:hypothetical protein
MAHAVTAADILHDACIAELGRQAADQDRALGQTNVPPVPYLSRSRLSAPITVAGGRSALPCGSWRGCSGAQHGGGQRRRRVCHIGGVDASHTLRASSLRVRAGIMKLDDDVKRVHAASSHLPKCQHVAVAVT